ncbi:hypothetical protein [Streptomyces sp. C1-2]|uniref:hypothetical protein n=1 Tax=Streptomyces sp. C1-2 TaxID=2720022 RepID=UPI0014324960|nr:hypothetical protein [Streptomyces sp. C1-2]NJP71045.1 hypothetical protein [Streptomyces sp. C1-2]
MRIRATVAAVSGALALSAFAVPAAHADGHPATPDHAAAAKVLKAGQGKVSVRTGTSGNPYALNATFSSVVVNKGKAIVAGTSKKVSVPVTFTLTHGTNVDVTAEDFFAGVDLYRGTSYADSDYDLSGDEPAVCKVSSATVAKCSQTIVIAPAEDLLNEDAGKWKAAAFAVAYNGQDPFDENLDESKIGVAVKDGFAAPNLQRYSKLTVNASPEPVKKGKTITVTGTLSRANWDTGSYAGYTVQSVKLQFKKKGSSSYSTLKTIKSGSKGALKTTVKASADGTFRYSFAGTSTTPAVSSSGDFVDVK